MTELKGITITQLSNGAIELVLHKGDLLASLDKATLNKSGCVRAMAAQNLRPSRVGGYTHSTPMVEEKTERFPVIIETKGAVSASV